MRARVCVCVYVNIYIYIYVCIYLQDRDGWISTSEGSLISAARRTARI